MFVVDLNMGNILFKVIAMSLEVDNLQKLKLIDSYLKYLSEKLICKEAK